MPKECQKQAKAKRDGVIKQNNFFLLLYMQIKIQ